MTDSEIEKFKDIIKESIQEKVNGKIDRLHQKFDSYVEQDTRDKEKIFDWQKKAEPVIQMGESVQGFGKVSLYLLGFIAALSGAIITIIGILKNK